MGAARKRNKILFITPPCHSGVVDVLGRWLPLNFVYMAGVARLTGLDAEIYDARTKNHGYAEIEKSLRKTDASYIAVTAITSTIDVSIKILELAKLINPHVITIMGGVHPSFCYEEVLNTTTAVDFIICGEGEATLKELLHALENGDDLSGISGLAFRQDGRIIKSSKRPLIGNIDELPTAWDLLEWQDYTYFVIPNSRLGAIGTSRGCELGGVLCFRQNDLEQKRRLRDHRNVVEEIVHLYETYGVNIFLIADERPARDSERWELFLELLIERGLPIYLLMESRSADIDRDRDIMWKYRKAGVVHVYIGIEAACQAADYSEKELDLTDGKTALDIIHEHGIVSEASFIVGLPEETRKSIEHTLRRAQYLNPDNVQFLPLTPWPYTDIYNDVRQYIRVFDYSKYNLIDPIIEPKKMSLLQMNVAIVDCYRKFYMGKMVEVMTMKNEFKRDYLMKAMKLIMGSSFFIKKMGMGTLGKVPAKIEEMMARINKA